MLLQFETVFLWCAVPVNHWIFIHSFVATHTNWFNVLFSCRFAFYCTHSICYNCVLSIVFYKDLSISLLKHESWFMNDVWTWKCQACEYKPCCRLSNCDCRVVRGSILCDPTQPNPLQVEKFGRNPTQPNTTNNGAYSLVVTYFYTKNLLLLLLLVNQAYFLMFLNVITHIKTVSCHSNTSCSKKCLKCPQQQLRKPARNPFKFLVLLL